MDLWTLAGRLSRTLESLRAYQTAWRVPRLPSGLRQMLSTTPAESADKSNDRRSPSIHNGPWWRQVLETRISSAGCLRGAGVMQPSATELEQRFLFRIGGPGTTRFGSGSD